LFCVASIPIDDAMRTFLTPATAAVIEFVLGHFAAQGVAVDAEQFGGAGLIAVGALQNAFDEALFKLAHGFIEQNSAFHHLQDQTFELISHVRLSAA
jgi:hypothetical protein